MRLASSRERRRVAVLAASAIATGGLAALPALPAAAATACDATYTVASSWAGGFQGGVTLNTGASAAELTYANGAKVVQTYATGGNAFGFVASGDAAAPVSVKVNGASCSLVVAPAAKTTKKKTTPKKTTITTKKCVTKKKNGAVTCKTIKKTVKVTTGKTSGKPTSDKPTSDKPTTGSNSDMEKAFLALYDKIHDSKNGYFSPDGVPYHSIETLVVEAPDWGHETTSEAYSYYLWLEAEYGRIKGDWAPFNKAWANLEKYMIPSGTKFVQGTTYNASQPAYVSPEGDYPDQYPVTSSGDTPSGSDPLYAELKSTYGNVDVYGMHWLMDVDNVYGFGECGDGTSKNVFINTFQRGPQESVWETVAQPSCETFKFGNPSKGGFLTIFQNDSNPSKQWKFTNAPDADGRAIQVSYWAWQYAKAQGKESAVSDSVAKAAKMGDFLRYAMYDKYFKQLGCRSITCAGATGKDGSAYLNNWYYAWGAEMTGAWSWRIGSSFFHQGYQIPMTAYVLGSVPEFAPKSPSAAADWQKSLPRILEFYTWLQSADGAIAGGATNSWNGRYEVPPAGTPTFYGMAYDWQPVYHDPPSNNWFGMQAWSMERLAEYYYETGNTTAKTILDKWVAWALKNTKVSGTTFSIPSTLEWSGQPGGDWKAGTTSVNNANLRVTVKESGNDLGVAGSYAKLLSYYAAKSGNTEAQTAAKGILTAIQAQADAQGYAVDEVRKDYERFDDLYNASTHQGLYIPAGWSGTYPNGDVIAAGKSFLDTRSFYKKDPNWSKVQAYLDGGSAPQIRIHRFWAQVDIATGFAVYAKLFPKG
ncbi:MAG: glycoside hydrolase family 48 protein [Kineosporiaceae bacterium]